MSVRIEPVPPFYRLGSIVYMRAPYTLDVEGILQMSINDTWMRGLNYAETDYINMFKVNADDEIDCGATLNIGAITAPEDGGAIVAMDMPVSATPAAGTEESFSYRVDGTTVIKIYAEADSAGGIQKPGLVVDYQINMKEMATPTAVADYGAIYTKNDNKLYFQDGAGVEHEVAFV